MIFFNLTDNAGNSSASGVKTQVARVLTKPARIIQLHELSTQKPIKELPAKPF
jgi:hypothetical protein